MLPRLKEIYVLQIEQTGVSAGRLQRSSSDKKISAKSADLKAKYNFCFN